MIAWAVFCASGCSFKPKALSKNAASLVPKPAVESLSAPSGFTGGGTALVLNGTGFSGSTRVMIDGAYCRSQKLLTPTQLQCVVPVHAAGAAKILVSNGSGADSWLDWTYQPDAFSRVDYLAGDYNGDLRGGGPIIDGSGRTARYAYIRSMVSDGRYVYISEAGPTDAMIRRVDTLTGETRTLAGSAGPNGTYTTTDGIGTAAFFAWPQGLTLGGPGLRTLFISDSSENVIRAMNLDTNEVTTFSGQVGMSGSADGSASTALFSSPSQMTTDGTFLYVVDTGTRLIRKVSIADGSVTTVAGSSTAPGEIVDGIGSAAHFGSPGGITFANGHLYVLDSRVVREVALSNGSVNTFVGNMNADLEDFSDGYGPSAAFGAPWDVATDGSNLYITDFYAAKIRKVTLSNGKVSTLVGATATNPVGHVDGPFSSARIEGLHAIGYHSGAGLFFASWVYMRVIR